MRLTLRHHILLDYIAKHQGTSVQEVSEGLGDRLSITTIRRYVEALSEAGHLVATKIGSRGHRLKLFVKDAKLRQTLRQRVTAQHGTGDAWERTRETSGPIAWAILALCTTKVEAGDLWVNARPNDVRDVGRLAFWIASPTAPELYWGDVTLCRGDYE